MTSTTTRPAGNLFITLEGIEGVGKSTVRQLIETYFTQRDLPYLASREPGGTVLAEAIRTLLLQPEEETVRPISELLLLFAARAQNIHHLLMPALAAGKWVVCDRFTDASFAYQGGGRQLPEAWIAQLEQWVGGLIPDCTILLDAPVDVALARLAKRDALDRIEQEQASFFDAIRQSYLERAARFPERYRVIDATQSEAAVCAEVQSLLDNLLVAHTA